MSMENEIKELMNMDTDFIKKKLQEEMQESIIREINYGLQDEIREVANEFIEEELADEIKKMLIEVKPQIIGELQESIIKICAGLGESMVEIATKNFSNGWNVRRITKEIFD